MFFQEWKDWLIFVLWVWLFAPNASRFFQEVVKKVGWYHQLMIYTTIYYDYGGVYGKVLILSVCVFVFIPILIGAVIAGPFVWVYLCLKDRRNTSPN